jgi:hypothetical protein
MQQADQRSHLLLCSDMRCKCAKCSRFSIFEMRLRPSHSSDNAKLFCTQAQQQQIRRLFAFVCF